MMTSPVRSGSTRVFVGPPRLGSLGALGSGVIFHTWKKISANVFHHDAGNSISDAPYVARLNSNTMDHPKFGGSKVVEGDLDLTGRVAKSVKFVRAYNKWCGGTPFTFDAESQTLTVLGRCGGVFEVEYEPAAPPVSYPDYDGASSNLETFIHKIVTCAIGVDEPIPSVWMHPSPGGDAPASVKAAWESYKLRRDIEVPDAREEARLVCAASTPGTITPTTTTPDVEEEEQGNGINTTPVPGDPYTPVTPVFYPPGGTDEWNPEGGGTVVTNPFAPPPVFSDEPRFSTRAKIGIGGAAVGLGLLALLMMRRGRKRRRRHSVASLPSGSFSR